MIGWTAVGLVIGLSAILLVVSLNRPPAMYQDLLAVPASESEQQGILLERRLANLYNQRNHEGVWATRFSPEQINGWLASDLPEKFPGILGKSFREPRILFSRDQFCLVFRYSTPTFRGVVQVVGDIFATHSENQIAFRIGSVKSGWMPIPVSWWADPLGDALGKYNIILEWGELNGDPVALLTLPGLVSEKDQEGTQKFSIVDAIQIDERGVGLSGKTLRMPGGVEDERHSVAGAGDSIQH